MSWSEASEQVSKWIEKDGSWIIEGVAIGRALRKWAIRNSSSKPSDRIIYLDDPKVELIEGQERMAKGCRTVWDEVEGILENRGCVVEEENN
jgi:hypothetical protein